MQMHAVESAAITHIGHDGEHLHVTYRGGRDYVHEDVPAATFQELLASDSKGKFIADRIRNQHPGRAK